MNHKMSAEQAAQEGVLVGEPYSPPGRNAVFDVPAYDDVADLQVLFKRFANTAASYTEAGGNVVNIGTNRDVVITDVGTTFLSVGDSITTVSITKFAFTQGMRFSVVQLGKAPVQIRGADGSVVVDGNVSTKGQYEGLTVIYSSGVWWCVPFGSSGGGTDELVPIVNTSAKNFTLTKDHVGALVAVDTGSSGDSTVTIPLDDGTIPVGSVIVVSNVGSLYALKVNLVAANGVTLQDRANAKIDRWRSAALIKRAANIWMINASSAGGESGSVPLPPSIKTAAGGPELIDLTWTLSTDDGGHSIQRYYAEVSSDNGATWVEKTSFGPTVTSGAVINLTADVAVKVRMRAVNSLGESDPSNVVSATPGPAKAPAPQISYTADGQFTITNYNAALLYNVSGASRTGDKINGVSNGATITAAFKAGAPVSNASVMNVLPKTRVLTDNAPQTSTGCGPRDNICCPDGRIQEAGGTVCGGAPGSFISDPGQAAAFCNGQCNDNCWQLTVSCYNWYWADYTSQGYTLIGNTWGKATNASDIVLFATDASDEEIMKELLDE